MVDISFPEIEKFDRLPEPRAEGPSAFVSIMEGRNKYCSFCVVPYTRGEEVSRPCDDILFEIAQLAAQGVREVNLLGQNVNAYRGETFDGQICSFCRITAPLVAARLMVLIVFVLLPATPLSLLTILLRFYEDTLNWLASYTYQYKADQIVF